jgi:hypothetical protein
MRARRRSRQGLSALLVALAVVALGVEVAVLGSGCDDGESLPAGQLCQPGENIFCRCPGGAPGTKACVPTGDAFDECGPCEDRPASGPGNQGAGGFGLGPGGGGGDIGVGGTGSEPILSPCEGDGECQSGMCRFNFCTTACTKVSDCPYPDSECVEFDDSTTICMPTCETAIDCVLFTAPPSKCGYTQAVDNWDVTVCAEWGTNHHLMPVGTDCLPFDHDACNLGYQQMQSVCTEQGVCAEGCYVNADCPMGKTCSAQGSLGNCQ